MAKDLGGFMKAFAGNMGAGLGGRPMGMSMGGTFEDNPGTRMFGMAGKEKPVVAGDNSFLQRSGGSLSDQLFQRAMMGFMNGG